MKSVAVVGSSSWGTVLAVLFARNGLPVRLCAYDEADAEALRRGGENARLEPGLRFPPVPRLGIAAGAQPLTLLGLAGVGDLMATCYSPLSRNHRVGIELAKGRSLDEALASLGQVAEGVATTVAARGLALRYRVEMPIIQMTYQVLFEGLDPRRAVAELMLRAPRHELHGVGRK